MVARRMRIGASGFAATSTESGDFLARTSGLDDTHKTRYDALITGLVTDGDYTKLDLLYAWATDTEANAALNLCPNASYNGAVSGTPTSFTADVGYTGDGSTFYIDTGFNPFSASSPQYVLNSAAIGIYVQTDAALGKGLNAVLADNVGKASIDAAYFGNTNYTINNQTAKSVAAATSKGSWIATRTGSGAVDLYRNGSTTPVDSDTGSSANVPRANIRFFAASSSLQMSAAFIGKGLTSTEMARIAARINTYMTAYSINVY